MPKLYEEGHQGSTIKPEVRAELKTCLVVLHVLCLAQIPHAAHSLQP